VDGAVNVTGIKDVVGHAHRGVPSAIVQHIDYTWEIMLNQGRLSTAGLYRVVKVVTQRQRRPRAKRLSPRYW